MSQASAHNQLKQKLYKQQKPTKAKKFKTNSSLIYSNEKKTDDVWQT